MPRGESFFAKYPDYRVDLVPGSEPVQVSFAGAVIAETSRPLYVRETKHDEVVYFAREDVNFALFHTLKSATSVLPFLVKSPSCHVVPLVNLLAFQALKSATSVRRSRLASPGCRSGAILPLRNDPS